MGKGAKRRKSPGRHTVRPTDPRYNVPSYPRGEGDLVTRESNTLIHAPLKSRCTNCGTIFEPSTIEHHQVCPKCNRKSGVPYHGESSKSRMWIDKWEREREEYIKRGKPLSKLEEKIARHKASLILGRNFGEEPEDYKRRKGLTEYYDWKLDTSGQKSDKETRKDLELTYIKAYKKTHGTWEGVNVDKMRSMSDSELRKSISSLKTKTKKKSSTEAYLSEKVDYGGERVSRGEMIKDLQEKAIQVYPDDKRAQERLVNSYLSGHGRTAKTKDERQMLERARVIGAAGRGEKGTRGKIIYTPSYTGSVGHYGGYFIDVPPSDLTRFKAMFPKGTFPRKTSIREGMMYVDGKPTTMLSVQFRDGTKAIEHLDNLEKKGELKLKIE